jgi:hypothetical protein
MSSSWLSSNKIFLLLAALFLTVAACGRTEGTTPAEAASARVQGNVFRDCASDIDAVLQRPEMRYLPPDITATC